MNDLVLLMSKDANANTVKSDLENLFKQFLLRRPDSKFLSILDEVTIKNVNTKDSSKQEFMNILKIIMFDIYSLKLRNKSGYLDGYLFREPDKLHYKIYFDSEEVKVQLKRVSNDI